MALEDDGPVHPFTRAWYKSRGEEYPDVIINWLHHEMEMEFCMRYHESLWGVPYGPTLQMVDDYLAQIKVKEMFGNGLEPWQIQILRQFDKNEPTPLFKEGYGPNREA